MLHFFVLIWCNYGTTGLSGSPLSGLNVQTGCSMFVCQSVCGSVKMRMHRVYVKVQKVNQFFDAGLGRFNALCLAAPTDFFSCFSSPESSQLVCGILSHHPPICYMIYDPIATMFLAEPSAKKHKKSTSWA